jgi:hypothetical protein
MSHLFPASLYAHMRDGTHGSPIQVAYDVVYPTDRQIQGPLLCEGCEDILNKGGETWVSPRLAWVDRRFELHDMLRKGGGYEDREGENLFYAANNPEVDVEKITHFALGIFWKAGVHSWAGGKSEPMIDLGGYEEEIRIWLRGESDFPEDVTLRFVISRPGRSLLTLNQPVEIAYEKKWRMYRFHAVGASFSMHVGKEIALEEREVCFYRNPDHMVLCSDFVTEKWQQKLLKEFREAKKTQAYLKSGTKRKS